MPAKSVAQRRFMAICEHQPQHAKGACPSMTNRQMSDFARTKEKGLPQHVPKKGGKA